MEQEVPKNQDTGRDAKGRFIPGVSGCPEGPHKGIKKRALQIKEIVFNAFDRWGGEERLVKWSKESKANEREFIKMVLSLLPKEIAVEGEGLSETKIIIIRNSDNKENGNQSQEMAGRVCVQQEAIPGNGLGVGNGQKLIPDIAGNAVQRADT